MIIQIEVPFPERVASSSSSSSSLNAINNSTNPIMSELVVTTESPRRSLSIQLSSLMIRLPYDKLPSQNLTLSILKLDSSSFHVEVAKTATVAVLKQSVEAAFKGPEIISWPHVWGQFCLCYEGQKLVTETDYLRDYGIKDGDQLCFVRHVSNVCNFQRNPKKRTAVENGKIQHCNGEENRPPGMNKLTGYLGGMFSEARMAVVRKARMEGGVCPSLISKGIANSFRKVKGMVGNCRKPHRRHTRKEFSSV